MKTRTLFIILVLAGVVFFVGGEAAGLELSVVANLNADPGGAIIGETVILEGSGSYDQDEYGSGGLDGVIEFGWDFDNDGIYDYNETATNYGDGAFDGDTTYVFESAGTYTVKLKVTDNDNPASSHWVTCDVNVGKVVNRIQEKAYSTIQAALDEADDMDVIVVLKGRYVENIDFDGVSCTLQSTDPTNWRITWETIIDGNGDGNVIEISNSESADCIVQGFTITNGDNGIYCEGSSPSISYCVISDNTAFPDRPLDTNDMNGGGLCAYGGSPSVYNCFFYNNVAGYYGGGMYLYGAAADIDNCVFADNTGCEGGAIFNTSSSTSITNCTFYDNYASGGCYYPIEPVYVDGGAIHSSAGVTITNCIVWDNETVSPRGRVDEIYPLDLDNVTYCDVNGGYAGGSNNINSDPLYYDEDNIAGADGIFGNDDDGLRLRFGSPCIDEANGNDAFSFDIAGLPRVDIDYVGNGGAGTPDYVDMGAYERKMVWYVDQSATSGNDNGQNWANAFMDLQDALSDAGDISATATAAGAGYEIWVAEGTYKPDETSPYDRELSFKLVESIKIYGGFDGVEDFLKQRDWKAYETVLSGDINSTGDNSDNSYHVVVGADSAILHGFTIQDGNAEGADSNSYGGGVYCNGTSPTISNCVIKDNCANKGSGMYVDGDSPMVTNCFFIDNLPRGTYPLGGGLYNSDSNMVLTNCVFSGNGNSGGHHGGGIYNHASSPTLISCTITGNEAWRVGGMYSEDSSPTVINSIFWDNLGGSDSNEIYNSSSTPTFSYCDIEGCGGSGNWDTDMGTNVGGNIDSDPCFVNDSNVPGTDGVFGTADDGLRLTLDSNCIDAATGSLALPQDVVGYYRRDLVSVPDTGLAHPSYTDIGAHEYSYAMMSGDYGNTFTLMYDKTLWCNGYNSTVGKLGNDSTASQPVVTEVHDGNMATVSGYMENIAGVSAGSYHSLAVDEAGFVWAWGDSTSGCLGDGYENDSKTAVEVVEGATDTDSNLLEDIVQVAAGVNIGRYSMALNVSGYVLSWGDNEYGQLGNGSSGDNEKELTPVYVVKGQMHWATTNLENIIDIDAGGWHSIALDDRNSPDANGNVWCWGHNGSGQLGYGRIDDDLVDSNSPVRVLKGAMGSSTDYLEGIIGVAASGGLYKTENYDYSLGSSYAVDVNGHVWAWGNNYYGQLGDDTTDYKDEPVQVVDSTGSGVLEDITMVSAGNYHVLALDANGHVWAWGRNNYGQLGNDTSGGGANDKPIQVKDTAGTGYLSDIVYIEAGYQFSLAIDSYGYCWAWGDNLNHALGLGFASTKEETPQKMVPRPH